MLSSQLSCLCMLCTRLEPRAGSAAQEQPAQAGIRTFSDSFVQNPKLWGASLLPEAISSISTCPAGTELSRTSSRTQGVLGCPGIRCKWGEKGLAPRAWSQGCQLLPRGQGGAGWVSPVLALPCVGPCLRATDPAHGPSFQRGEKDWSLFSWKFQSN